ncbi:hypothetical protein ACFU8W_52030 [Streptomyces sp. NPDC057565]|uniref:hypothetical protein n=1 Tax=unclassified Streptomyces TaxID=2593676 RepID=UPI0036CB69DD
MTEKDSVQGWLQRTRSSLWWTLMTILMITLVALLALHGILSLLLPFLLLFSGTIDH